MKISQPPYNALRHEATFHEAARLFEDHRLLANSRNPNKFAIQKHNEDCKALRERLKHGHY